MNCGGRPVEINTLTPLSFALLNASMVSTGISWVLKLTNVPSISKNNAFIITFNLILSRFYPFLMRI
jgi:hypothetical protein